LNERCVELAVRTAIALGSIVNKRSTFDRKHYFYPDLPQGYQITQHYSRCPDDEQRDNGRHQLTIYLFMLYVEAVANGGELSLTEKDGVLKPLQVRIEQVQLEQDTGKSIHDMRPDMTLLDLNRAGSGLMEIVTKPDMRYVVLQFFNISHFTSIQAEMNPFIRSALEAGQFVKKLQSLLRCIGSSNANMEEVNLLFQLC
jgi:aspartyl-tRNA(Asn)/glutamyl-tRNA(Gln) amidotransferase subunit B